MKKEKIFEFEIDHPLTAAKRKSVEKHIERNAGQAGTQIAYHWDEEDGEVLHIAADPVLIEVHFEDRIVALYAAAPLWARLLFTEKKKTELKQQIEAILHKAKFVSAKKA